MADLGPQVQEISRAMQVAIAPVFLISGAGGILAAMAVRYGRAIDRAREVLRDFRTGAYDEAWRATAEEELGVHYRRARLLRVTIITNALSIFAVALCILMLFASVMLAVDVPYVVPLLFSLGLTLLLASVGLFTLDFAVSLRALRLEIRASLRRAAAFPAIPVGIPFAPPTGTSLEDPHERP